MGWCTTSSLAVMGNWSADIKSLTVLEISFWSAERRFAKFLVVGRVVKLSIGFFDVEVSVPHNNLHLPYLPV